MKEVKEKILMQIQNDLFTVEYDSYIKNKPDQVDTVDIFDTLGDKKPLATFIEEYF